MASAGNPPSPSRFTSGKVVRLAVDRGRGAPDHEQRRRRPRGQRPGARSDEYVALGAHYDHLGTAQKPNAAGDTIYNGADDDGSGTVGLLAIAEAFATAKVATEAFTALRVAHGRGAGPVGLALLHRTPDRAARSRRRPVEHRHDRPWPRARHASRRTGPLRAHRHRHGLRGRLEAPVDDTRRARSNRPTRATTRCTSTTRSTTRATRPRSTSAATTTSTRSAASRWRSSSPGVHADYHGLDDEVDRIDFTKLRRVTQTIYAAARAIADGPRPASRAGERSDRNDDVVAIGLHHVTATVDDAQPDLDFCVGLLGLRLVKQTVNFDNHHVFHFYYGDERGTPGTIWTTFPYRGHGVRVGTIGAGQVVTTAFSVPAASIDAWRARLAAAGLAVEVSQPFGETHLVVRDPSGLVIALVGTSRRRAQTMDARRGAGDGRARPALGDAGRCANPGPTLEFLHDVLGCDGPRTRRRPHPRGGRRRRHRRAARRAARRRRRARRQRPRHRASRRAGDRQRGRAGRAARGPGAAAASRSRRSRTASTSARSTSASPEAC